MCSVLIQNDGQILANNDLCCKVEISMGKQLTQAYFLEYQSFASGEETELALEMLNQNSAQYYLCNPNNFDQAKTAWS